jgi:hypothetical protein
MSAFSRDARFTEYGIQSESRLTTPMAPYDYSRMNLRMRRRFESSVIAQFALFAMLIGCSSPIEQMTGTWRAEANPLGIQDFEIEIELAPNGTFEKRSRLAGVPKVILGRWTAEKTPEEGIRLGLSPQGKEREWMEGKMDGDVFVESLGRSRIRWTRVAR